MTQRGDRDHDRVDTDARALFDSVYQPFCEQQEVL